MPPSGGYSSSSGGLLGSASLLILFPMTACILSVSKTSIATMIMIAMVVVLNGNPDLTKTAHGIQPLPYTEKKGRKDKALISVSPFKSHCEYQLLQYFGLSM